MQSSRTKPSTKRRGFTLIELLVVISIIATLMSLILPAIQNAREAGRRTQCLNNIRNVTLATLNFASANKSRLPALGYFPSEATYVAAGGTASASGRIMGRSWAVELLPYLDQQGTFDRWNKDIPFNDGTNAALPDIYIEAFACPNDDSAFQQPGGLSYVANAGFGTADVDITNDAGAVQHSPVAEPFDWNGNGTVNVFGSTSDDDDRRITQATGVFWAEFDGVATTRNASASVGKIYDGSGNTLMFGENINAGGTNWADPRTRACGFMFPLDAASVDATTMANASGFIGADTLSTPAPAFPNEAKTGPEGVRPYLNSNHPGIVVVSFCDGAARTISESIDQNVYVRLMTPDGTRLRTTSSSEDPVSADEF
ncbi:MAG: DUF1559 domain-containing protein [Planctomycetaceae bacterium]|nr:DUF1559 domain-containing protein [Planctomycetaceae bacterium]